MACTKEINQGDTNKIVSCLSDTDEVIVLRKVMGVYQPFRITYAELKSCIIAPPSISFIVDDPANNDIPDVLTFPLGGGTIFFSSSLIGRRSVIVMVNTACLPQKARYQPDYCTPDFTTGEIIRPDGFKTGDFVEVYFL